MTMETPLLATKLYFPAARATLVSRARLVSHLRQGLTRPLTLICAPAGFGKTTLLSDWRASAAARDWQAAWLSLDADDNDPVRFLTYLIHAVRVIKPGLGETALLRLKDAQPPGLQTILAAVINEFSLVQPAFVLVLDDYHQINASPVHEVVSTLLDHLPAAMHVVILSRADPALPLARLRARDQLTEIRGPDLRFAPDEAGRFLNGSMGLELSASDVASLGARTEGWIAGLQLAALSLRQEADRHAFVSAFAGDDRYVMDYLLEEVFQRQPPDVQTFLLKTSLLERLCAPLCEAVTGETQSQALLALLDQSNLFVLPLDNRRYWYRYHSLFADLLRRRLHQSLDDAEYQALVRRACDWLEQQGDLEAAIAQALSAGVYECAAGLLERHVLTVFFRSETGLVHRWLASLPENLRSEHPLLEIVYANTLAHAAGFEAYALQTTEARLKAAEQHLGTAGQADPALTALAYSFLKLSKAYLALWRSDPPETIIALAQHALDGLPPVEQPQADPNYLRLRSSLNFNLGLCFARLGDEAAADQAFSRAREIGLSCGDLLNACAAAANQASLLRRRGNLREAAALCRSILDGLGETGQTVPYAGVLHIALGQILLEWNELSGAEAVLAQGLELSGLIAAADGQLEGRLAMARLRQAQGDPPAALAMLEQAETSAPNSSALVATQRTRLYLAQPQEDQASFELALRWARERRLEDPDPDWHQAVAPTLARVLIRSSRLTNQPELGPVCDFLESQRCFAEARGWMERAIELLVLQSLAWETRGDLPAARQCLKQALGLAAPGGYVRLFLEFGPPVQRILGSLRSELDSAGLGYLERLLAAGRDPSRPSPNRQKLVDPLTTRELEVLALLMDGATNARIARSLVISMNTTKKHVTHIFEKLAVTDRRAAVSRAVELGLITAGKR